MEGNEFPEGNLIYQPLGSKSGEHIQLENNIQLMKWVNFLAGTVFLAQLIVYTTIVIKAEADISMRVPVNCRQIMCKTSTSHVGKIPIQIMFPVIVGTAFVHHLGFFFQCLYNDWRIRRWFAIEINPMRWFEYSLTYSLESVLAGILVGVNDVHLLLLLFVLTSVGMGLGQILGLMPRIERPDIWPVSFRFVRALVFVHMVTVVLVPWIVLLCYYGRAVQQGLPIFAHVYFWTALISLVALGVILMEHRVRRRIDLATAELNYVYLSLIGKTALGVALYVGLSL